jgi:hypothetical protein
MSMPPKLISVAREVGAVAKSGQEESYEKILAADLQRVIDFLKFAEAKNGALLTFASAWILAIIGLLSGDRALPVGVSTAFSVVLPLVDDGWAFSRWHPSYRASIWDRSLAASRAGPHPKNLPYFGDISLYDRVGIRTGYPRPAIFRRTSEPRRTNTFTI